MNKLALALIICMPFRVFCQAPETDIWLMHIKEEGGKIRFADPKNITNRKGYDNQPAFSRDGKVIYFTSLRDTTGQTDIYTYAISSGETKQYTFTATSEYSPTCTPDGKGISVLMVEEDSSQRIWELPFSGGKPFTLFPEADSIGYYTWVNDSVILAFILSDGKTNHERLSLVGGNGTEKLIAEAIGRGMKIYGSSALFVKTIDSVNYLYLTDYRSVKKLVKTPAKSQDLAIFKDYVLMASGETMYGAGIQEKNNEFSLLDFIPLQDLSPYGLNKITRIAISPDGKTIAVAASGE